MSKDMLNVVAPRLLFAGALAGLGLIAVNAPAWADALKLQGYYTDFSLRLSAQRQVIAAGRSTHVGVEVASLGPDTAEQPVLTLREDADIRLLEGVECVRQGQQSMRCALPPLQPGEILPQRLVPLITNPDARGLRLVSGFVSAETAPSASGPGLNVDATWVELVGKFDTGMRLLDEVPTPLPEDFLRWTFELDNAGPSSVVEGYLGISTNNSYRESCRAFGGAICPQFDGRVYLPAGSRIEFDFEAPQLEMDTIGISFVATFFSPEGLQIGPRPRVVSMNYSPWISGDGFEQ